MNPPEPETEEFNQLGPEARKLSRMIHNVTPIHEGEQKTANETLDRFTEGAA